jgi:hypothetical protein
MSEGLSAIIYPLTDLSASKKVYSHVLGVEPVMDQPYYVGYRVGDLDVGLDPNGHAQGMTAPIGTGRSMTSTRPSRHSSTRAPWRSRPSRTSAAASSSAP